MVYRSLDRYPLSVSTVTAYLLHFSEPFGHAQHYIGVVTGATELAERLHKHATGSGAKLCARAVQAGVTLILARVWENVPRYTEQRLKNRGGASRLCPICRAERESADAHLDPGTDSAESGEVGGGERGTTGV